MQVAEPVAQALETGIVIHRRPRASRQPALGAPVGFDVPERIQHVGDRVADDLDVLDIQDRGGEWSPDIAVLPSMAPLAFCLRLMAYCPTLFSAVATIQQPRQEDNSPTLVGETCLKFMPANLPTARRNKAR
jgi:hypothetical protein